MFLERHFERVVARAALYRALDNSGVVDLRRDHAWAMRERAVQALAEHLGKTGPKDTEDLDSLARMITGVIAEMRYAMIQTGKPTPGAGRAPGARASCRAAWPHTPRSTRAFPGLFSDEWREVLEREADVPRAHRSRLAALLRGRGFWPMFRAMNAPARLRVV